MVKSVINTILIAEDDADDRFLLGAAFQQNAANDNLVFVENGVELFDFLKLCLKSESTVLPRFILLDLNMPKKDGREVIKEIKSIPILCNIPIVVFSTANSYLEMQRCYDLGANSYITKPNSFEQLVRTVAAIRLYWLHTNLLPFRDA
jgi:two-component system response regulator